MNLSSIDFSLDSAPVPIVFKFDFKYKEEDDCIYTVYRYRQEKDNRFYGIYNKVEDNLNLGTRVQIQQRNYPNLLKYLFWRSRGGYQE
jgi:hypothetical protein